MRTDCIILGGGASGLAAAASLRGAGMRVTLVERLDRVGKKILATGNGRCNISNANLDPSNYAHASAFVRTLYASVTAQDVAAFFSGLGLMTTQEHARIYPRSMMAASVLDVLRSGCSYEDMTTLTGCEAVSITPSRRGGYSVQLSSGEGLFAPYVIAAMGGCAAPSMGTDGAGYRLLEQLGHSVSPLYPALVQLKCEHPALRSLKGLRTHAAVTLTVDEEPVSTEDGELLFADYGLSGVCIFQLSRFVGEPLAMHRRVALKVNLLPEIPTHSLSAWLDERIRALSPCTALALLTGVFPRMLAMALLREAGISPDADVHRIPPMACASLLQAISSFTFPVVGTQGFKNAQVTRGGVSLSEVDPATMGSRIFDGLYLCGELLDVDGPCGGYNLHFAFASALAAARDIRSRFGA